MFVAVIKTAGKLLPSDQFPKVYRTAGHIKSALANRSGCDDWVLDSETPDLLTFKPRVIQEQSITRGHGRQRYELYKRTVTPADVRLYFVNVAGATRRRLDQLLG
jgi:hypothetical protein